MVNKRESAVPHQECPTSESASRRIPGIAFADLAKAIEKALLGAGADPTVAEVLANNCASCERDGALSHGIFRLPGYLRTISSGWANARAVPHVQRPSSGFIRVDADNGFAQPALKAAREEIDDAIQSAGVAVVAIRNSHHLSALWPDLEPFAEGGLVGLTMVSGGPTVLPRGAQKKVLGTNPIAFATPLAGALPLVADFATSTMSLGDLQLEAEAGRSVPTGVGTGRCGRDTNDPAEILHEGGLLPFGGHKGTALAMLVELFASGLTGGEYSYRGDLVLADSPEIGSTARTGQLLIFIDPTKGGFDEYADRARQFTNALREAGLERLPADQRYASRALAEENGIPVTDTIRALLEGQLS